MRPLAAFILLLVWAGPAWGDCHFEYVRVTERRVGPTVDVDIENLVTAALTITWDVDVHDNVAIDHDLHFTEVLPGRERRRVFRVHLPANGRWQYHYKYHLRVGDRSAQHDDSAVYRLPYRSGQSFAVIQGFNGSFSHFGPSRNAIDWRMPIGTEVCAAREGTVVFTIDTYTEGAPDRDLMECSNHVIVRHPDGTYGEYDHLDFHGVTVKVGDFVKAGDVIGRSGFTGFTTEPHLHFVVYRPVDGNESESFPIRYRVSGDDGPVILQQGQTYTAP